ncbi:MAG: MFS transporter [Vicinamibacteria bacterium]
MLGFAFALSVVTYLDRVCISTAAPFITRDLGLTMMQMSVVFSAFTLAYSLFEIPSGWLADTRGARSVLTRIVLWWSAFTILTGAAWSYLSLVVIRFLFGAGEAGAFPGVSRAFSRWFPLRERGRANGFLFLGSRVGGALAPALSLFLIHRWGWRASFVAFGSIGIVWSFLWYRFFRDEPEEHPDASQSEVKWIRQDGPAVRGHSPVPWASLLKSWNLYAICGMYFAFGYGLYFYFTWLPTYLIDVLGFSTFAGGALAGLPFVLAGGADLLGGLLTDRLSAARGLKVGRSVLGCCAFFGSAFLLLGSTALEDRVHKALLIALALASADLGLAAAWAVCLDVGRRHAGVVTGAMNTFGNLGGMFAPLVVGFLVERFGSWSVAFQVSAAIYAMGGLLWLAIDPTRQLTSHPEDDSGRAPATRSVPADSSCSVLGPRPPAPR